MSQLECAKESEGQARTNRQRGGLAKQNVSEVGKTATSATSLKANHLSSNIFNNRVATTRNITAGLEPLSAFLFPTSCRAEALSEGGSAFPSPLGGVKP
jgi:hypothetical protein